MPLTDGGALNVAELGGWGERARTQELPAGFGVDPVDDAHPETFFALEDRQSLEDAWPGRKVFVGLGKDIAWLFDEQGVKIDDPDHHITKGGQPMDGDHGFRTDWSQGYFRKVPREPEPEPADALTSLLRPGARVRIALTQEGPPPNAVKWFGALVGEQIEKDSVIRFEFGYDDGDILYPKKEDLQALFGHEMLEAIPSELGPTHSIVKNLTGDHPASAFIKIKDGAKTKTIGLLLCKEDKYPVFGEPVYADMHIKQSMFPSPKTGRHGETTTPMQDRLGLHTFRRGDRVKYLHLQADEICPAVAVYGCIYPKPGGGSSADQGRKYLVLYEVETRIFFLGACPHWRRVPKDAECADFDHTKDDQVSRLSTDLEDNQKQKMINMWACSETARALIGDWSRAQREAAKPPPSLKIARAKAEEARKQEERARVAREKEEARRRQMEREKAAGGHGGSGSKSSTRGHGRERPSSSQAGHPPPQEQYHPPPQEQYRQPPMTPPPRPQYELETPPSLVQMKRMLFGLKSAQAVEASADRARQIGELEFDLERREQKRRRYHC